MVIDANLVFLFVAGLSFVLNTASCCHQYTKASASVAGGTAELFHFHQKQRKPRAGLSKQKLYWWHSLLWESNRSASKNSEICDVCCKLQKRMGVTPLGHGVEYPKYREDRENWAGLPKLHHILIRHAGHHYRWVGQVVLRGAGEADGPISLWLLAIGWQFLNKILAKVSPDFNYRWVG